MILRIFLLIIFIPMMMEAKGQDTLVYARQLFDNKQYQDAVMILDEYLRSHPADTQAFELCGDAYAELTLHHIAAQRYTKAIELWGRNRSAMRKRAITFYLMEEYRAASNEWEEVCRLEPGEKINWYYKALVNQKLSRYQQAISDLNNALAIDSDFLPALEARKLLFLKTQQYESALYDIDTLLKIKQYSEDLFISRGLALIGLKRYKEAEQTFNRILKRNSKNTHAWFGIGSVYHASGNFPKAIEAYNEAITFKPDFELAYFKRGLAHLELRKQNEACDDLMEALRRGYSDAAFYLQRYCGRGQ